jgi:hypothetical protein
MNKLRMLVLTGLAAAMVGTGALAAAPSASAAAATTTPSASASLDRPKICFPIRISAVRTIVYCI